MKRLIQRAIPLLLAMILTVGMAPAALAADGTPVHGFTDVHATDYYADAVAWAADQGVTGGTSETTFSPHDTVTRAQAVTFLWRAAGSPQPERASSPFVDVSSSDYYYVPVLWAAEEGITGGVSADRFGPEETLAYDQIFTFISKLVGESGTGADWSEAAVNWAEESGLTEGLTYTAKGACPRSDVVYCLFQRFSDGWEEPQPEEDLLALTGNQAVAADIMDALTSGYSIVDLTGYDVDLNTARKLAEELADVSGDNPYQVERIVGTMDLSGKALRLEINYIGGTAANGASRAAMEEADAVLEQVVTAGMSDYDIAKALHDYLVLNCAYDYDNYLRNTIPAESYTAEGALLEGTAVCSGYAKAYQLLMQRAGIPCEYVTGYAGGSHAWNVVQIDGEWYHVDTTWDDPVPDKAGYVRYDYFLKSDAYMRDNRHSRWNSDYACTSTRYDGADLPDTEEQAEQEALNEILAICFDAIADFPYQTEAALQAATEDQLQDARYAYIDFSGSGIDASLLSQYRGQVSQAITEQYPDFMVLSFDRTNMRYELRRADVTEEIQRRQEAQKEEQEEQQAQEDAENAAAAAQIQAILEQAIADMDCESTTITLTSYTDDAIKQACKNMCTDGYSFGDYTYSLPAINADYSVSAQSGGVVKLTNKKWAEAELQRYVEQIEEAIDDGEFSVKLLPGNYPDQDGSHYAFNAYNRVRKDSYTTASGKVSGEDYVLFSGGSNKDTDVFSASIQYPLPVMDEEEAQSYYIGLIEDAIRNRETEVQLQYKFGDQDYSGAAYAVQRAVTSSGYEVDGLVYWKDYRLSWGTNSYSGVMTITIQYQ